MNRRSFFRLLAGLPPALGLTALTGAGNPPSAPSPGGGRPTKKVPGGPDWGKSPEGFQYASAKRRAAMDGTFMSDETGALRKWDEEAEQWVKTGRHA